MCSPAAAAGGGKTLAAGGMCSTAGTAAAAAARCWLRRDGWRASSDGGGRLRCGDCGGASGSGGWGGSGGGWYQYCAGSRSLPGSTAANVCSSGQDIGNCWVAATTVDAQSTPVRSASTPSALLPESFAVVIAAPALTGPDLADEPASPLPPGAAAAGSPPPPPAADPTSSSAAVSAPSAASRCTRAACNRATISLNEGLALGSGDTQAQIRSRSQAGQAVDHRSTSLPILPVGIDNVAGKGGCWVSCPCPGS